MRRAIYNVAAVAGVGLAVGLCVLWWRSVTRADRVYYVRSSGNEWSIGTVPHGLILSWVDYRDTFVACGNALLLKDHGWYAESLTYLPGDDDVALTAHVERPPRPALLVAHAADAVGPTTGRVGVRASANGHLSPSANDYYYTGPFLPFPSVGPSHLPHMWGGFGYQWETDTFFPPTDPDRTRAAEVPFWFLVPASLVPAGLLMAGRVRRRRRRVGGRCARCGYDLRGSAGRCPECGAGAADGTAAGPSVDAAGA